MQLEKGIITPALFASARQGVLNVLAKKTTFGRFLAFVESDDGRSEFARVEVPETGSIKRRSVFEVDAFGAPRIRHASVVSAQERGEARRFSAELNSPPLRAKALGKHDSLHAEAPDAPPWWRRRASSVAATEYKGINRRRSSVAVKPPGNSPTAGSASPSSAGQASPVPGGRAPVPADFRAAAN
mmetsp:Transcript_6585/g.20800  ORF Transcript_6585/g.20800 Transcript_6585/m.20800 type:complete len:185 (+) Transcript_6585:825-1379(+)